MSSIEDAVALHRKLNESFSAMEEATEIAGKLGWFVESSAAPHLSNAAQAVFVAQTRLMKAADNEFGPTEWGMAIKSASADV